MHGRADPQAMVTFTGASGVPPCVGRMLTSQSFRGMPNVKV
jgi:hypothetical protein